MNPILWSFGHLSEAKLKSMGKQIQERILTDVGNKLKENENIRELREVRAVPVRIRVRDQVIWTRTDITGNANSLFKAAGVAIPPKIQSWDW